MRLHNFDVLFVRFPLQEDHDVTIPHPAAVIDGSCYLMTVCTSKLHKPYYDELNYQILDWKGAGLRKPTVIKLNRQSHIDDDDIIVYLGHLSDEDIANIEELLSRDDLKSKIDILESADDNINESKDLKIPKEILQATKDIEYQKITGTNDGSYYIWPMTDDLQVIRDVVKTLRSKLPNYEIKAMIDTTSKHRKIRLMVVNDSLLDKIQHMFDVAQTKQQLKLVNTDGETIIGDADFNDLRKLSYSDIVQLKNWLELSIWHIDTHGFYMNPVCWINDRILSKYNLYIQML